MFDTSRDASFQDQLSLFGGEHSSLAQSDGRSRHRRKRKSTDRFFFAIQPDAVAIEQSLETARHLRAEYRLSGRPFPDWRFHVSLEGLGDFVGVPKSVLQRAHDIASSIHIEEFRIRFDKVTTFGPPGKPTRAIVLTATEKMHKLTLLMGLLFTGIHDIPVAPTFTPHMTLLYDTQSIDDIAVEPVTWTVREFVLIHNVLRTGRPYEILGRWPLLRSI